MIFPEQDQGPPSGEERAKLKIVELTPAVGANEPGIQNVNISKLVDGPKRAPPDPEESDLTFLDLFEINTQDVYGMGVVMLYLTLFSLALAYSCVIVYGAVKMQSLDSYQWSMVASIMSIVPIQGLSLSVLAFILLNILSGMLLDETYGIPFAG